MHHDSRKGRDIQSAIADVLLAQWDPIGVAGVPEAADEYDAYVGPIYRLLSSSATDKRLAEYLADIQANAMGLSDPGWRALLPVAHALQQVFSRFSSTSPAT
jgi:hypothetical protein